MNRSGGAYVFLLAAKDNTAIEEQQQPQLVLMVLEAFVIGQFVFTTKQWAGSTPFTEEPFF